MMKGYSEKRSGKFVRNDTQAETDSAITKMASSSVPPAARSLRCVLVIHVSKSGVMKKSTPIASPAHQDPKPTAPRSME